MAELQDVLDKLDLVNDVKLEIKDVISTDSLHFEDYPNLIAEHLTDSPSEQTIADRVTANGATIKDGVAFLKALKGNSIKWNQLCKMEAFVSRTINGVTYTLNQANGIVSVSGTCTATYSIAFITIGDINQTHTYFVIPRGNYNTSGRLVIMNKQILAPMKIVSPTSVNSYYALSNGQTADTGESFGAYIFDLTAMGWEDITTADQFAQRLGFASANDIPSFPYDGGSIKHFSASEIVSKGRNIWDGGDLVVTADRTGGDNVTASLKGGVTYTFSFENADGTEWRYLMRLKDKQGNNITSGVVAGAYITYRSDYNGFFSGRNVSLKNIQITCDQDADMEIRILQGNLVVGSKVEGCCLIEGDTYKGYKPYMTPSSLPLPSVSLYSAGTARDELDLAQGKLTRRIGVVDMGTLNWEKSTSNRFRCQFAEALGTSSGIANVLCAEYENATDANVRNNTKENIYALNTGGWIYIYINATFYADNNATQMKAYMQGKVLYYELATPTTTDVDKSKAFYKVENGGREQVDTTTSSPLVATIAYEH